MKNILSASKENKPLAVPLVPNQHLALLLKTIGEKGCHPILVGGAVRDHLSGIKPVDFDIEVYGLEAQVLEEILRQRFTVIAVGRSFGIFKVVVNLHDEQKSFDVAMPRNENKSGSGHKGFVIATNPHMSFKEAASRRDFTINAMGIDTSTNTLLDPFDGETDLNHKILRHISPSFSEDPLRVLRAAQFCARFNLKLAEATVLLCQHLKYELLTLSRERIFEELKKLLLAATPSIGLKVLQDTGALILFPELEDLIGCAQDPEWHPEGDVWVHTLMVTDKAAHITALLPEEERLIVMAGALCHDLGKPATTILKDGRTKSPGHEQAGKKPTLSLLTKMGFPLKWHQEITSLVEEHLKPFQLYAKRDEVSDGAIRRLSTRVNVEHLLLVSKADFLGRTTKEALAGYDPSEPWLRGKLAQLLGHSQKPTPILQGRHLLALGLKPGSHFSPILRQAFEAQLDGIFNTEEEGILWLKNNYLNPLN